MSVVLGESPRVVAWRRLTKNRGAVISMVVLGLMILMAMCAPLITPFDPSTQILEYSVKPAMFRGSVLYKRNPADASRPSIIAVSSFEDRGDSVTYLDPAGEPYKIAKTSLMSADVDSRSRAAPDHAEAARERSAISVPSNSPRLS